MCMCNIYKRHVGPGSYIKARMAQTSFAHVLQLKLLPNGSKGTFKLFIPSLAFFNFEEGGGAQIRRFLAPSLLAKFNVNVSRD